MEAQLIELAGWWGSLGFDCRNRMLTKAVRPKNCPCCTIKDRDKRLKYLQRQIEEQEKTIEILRATLDAIENEK